MANYVQVVNHVCAPNVAAAVFFSTAFHHPAIASAAIANCFSLGHPSAASQRASLSCRESRSTSITLANVASTPAVRPIRGLSVTSPSFTFNASLYASWPYPFRTSSLCHRFEEQRKRFEWERHDTHQARKSSRHSPTSMCSWALCIRSHSHCYVFAIIVVLKLNMLGALRWTSTYLNKSLWRLRLSLRYCSMLLWCFKLDLPLQCSYDSRFVLGVLRWITSCFDLGQGDPPSSLGCWNTLQRRFRRCSSLLQLKTCNVSWYHTKLLWEWFNDQQSASIPCQGIPLLFSRCSHMLLQCSMMALLCRLYLLVKLHETFHRLAAEIT